LFASLYKDIASLGIEELSIASVSFVDNVFANLCFFLPNPFPVNSLDISNKSDLISFAAAKDKLFLFFLISFKNLIISSFSVFKPIFPSSSSANFFKSKILTASGFVFASALSTAIFYFRCSSKSI